ncbi:glycoside hydrolase family 38 C-terminal domain-containing protein [Streptomyces sp. AgN23]|uniref:alpha-mannosidase n=1 Tax=Streptomyces sp. AgN23 TaxID=1188315 RepID=UPI001B331650|nr:glycoside hydrolase family 38 C-terminal domain-containing protein [Streptomyces sp. AgN23]QTI87696.1 alpha-mannosidase [Streptomyces sp. AgN23]WTB09985.1 glycosyl hydrolase-related protein [Streptomyces antimycoticus]
MHDDRHAVEERIAKFIAERLRPALYGDRVPLEVAAWHIPGEPVPVADALRAEYRPFVTGDSWGGPWSTTWFRATATVPERWAGRRVEALFDLGFDLSRGPGGQAEGLVHDADGIPLQGLHPRNRSVPLSLRAVGGERVCLLVEAAANPTIVGSAGIGTHYGHRLTAGEEDLYRLRRADLVIREEDVWQLLHDMEVLDELMRELPLGLPRRHEILRALQRAVDSVPPRRVAAGAAAARAILRPVLERRAHDSAHTIAAVGHAHIDSAWLWPLRETVRKCARTFSTMASLAEEYPELVFACSSALSYAWMRDHQPYVFERIKKAVADGNWAPVGGMWVEADGNLPGGEALARQLVHGRRFFSQELGVETDGVWLPDSFGCTAAYPQLAALAGARWFLTQKLSWNETNKPPHHTFWWEGIDGTRIFTHFPPVDTCNATLSGAELAHAAATYAEKGAGTRSLAPFGFGDGGGGPTREMLEKARRLADLEGSPRVSVQSPSDFFREAREEYPDAPVWRGELYLETHRGTYTSQARTKRGNRRSEALLREAELWAATAAVRTGEPYPYETLDALWKQVLLHQFHDILPGTSISWVHQQAEQTYRAIHRGLERIVARAAGTPDATEPLAVLNAAPHARREVVRLDTPPAAGGPVQRLSDGRYAVLAQAPALGAAVLGTGIADRAPVTARPADTGGYVLHNGALTVHIDRDGLVRSAYDHDRGREAIAPGGAGNLLQLHPDDPVRWSAWNLDAQYRNVHRDLDTATAVRLDDQGPLLACVRVERTTGRSVVVQRLSLAAGSRVLEVDTDIDWREEDTVLKAAWPLDVHAERVASEIQFGHVERPTHENTSWDAARFEAWAHRWIHIGEHGWGAALLTDSTYGHDVSRLTREDGGTTTTLRLTLLRGSHSPDPHADRGRHRFRYALYPGADIGDAVAGGYAFSLPLRPAAPRLAGPPLVAVGDPGVVVEAVKLADDRSGDVVVRLYESRGGRARTTLAAGFAVGRVQVTDLLENPTAELTCAQGVLALTLRPFQILTLRLARGAS